MIPLVDDVPARRYPVITVSLIALNIGVFLYQLSLPVVALDALIADLGVVPVAFTRPATPVVGVSFSVLASMFLHGGWIHLIGNVWYLWIFGDNVEDRMGHLRFLIFYLLCGGVAAAVQILSNVQSNVPMIGASGAIAGVLGAYLLSFPFARVTTVIPLILFWPIVQLPAVIVLGSWFLFQIGSVWVASDTGVDQGVAFWAHIGGFLTGMLLLNLFARREHRLRRGSAR